LPRGDALLRGRERRQRLLDRAGLQARLDRLADPGRAGAAGHGRLGRDPRGERARLGGRVRAHEARAGMSRGTRATGWRKVAVAVWHGPNDPQIYGDLEVDATPLQAFIEQARASSGVRVTVTHAVGKAIAHALAEHPDLNVRLRRGRFVPRESVDIF